MARTLALAVALIAPAGCGHARRSFEGRLRDAVSARDCARICLGHRGFYGDYTPLRRGTVSVFTVDCEVLGPSAALYRYRTRRAFRAALPAARSTEDLACASASRLEILVLDDARHPQRLCAAHGLRTIG